MFEYIDKGCGIKAWWNGVTVEDKAREQYANIASLPFVGPHVAAMPDSHWGMGGPVGAVVPTQDAIVPSLVGVDIGCGMMAAKTFLEADKVNQSLPLIRALIEKTVPHGRTNNGQEGDRGAWHDVPADIADVWTKEFYCGEGLNEFNPGAVSKNAGKHLGTLGTGNHFIECSLDENNEVWIVLHSGSRGFGNRIGSYFTKLAKEKMEQYFITLADPNLAYFPKGIQEYGNYVSALHLAQKYAWRNREIMMTRILLALGTGSTETVHCHHNYMAEEKHFGKHLLITRKGAVRAQKDDMVIIPGAMGRATIIGRGLGNRDSFCSCSHGAGRSMSRTEALKRFTVDDHIRETNGLECDKTEGVLDETPMAYKDVEAVLAAQSDLVQEVHRLKAVVCVKGLSD